MNAFKRAENAYIQYLTAEERSRIRSPINLSTLVILTQKLGDDLRYSDGGKSVSTLRSFGEKAMLLEPFEKLVEGATKMSPLAGSMIWGSILFILEMAKSNSRVFDEVLKFFDRFADEMVCLGLQKQTFSTSPLVQSVIEDLYSAILDFWVAALKYYRSKLGGLRSRFKTFVMASSIEKQFDLLKVEIVEQKVRLHNVSSAEHNARSSSFYATNSSFQQATRQRELENWLNAADYEHDLRTANDLRYSGTCEWMKSKESYINWSLSTSYAFLYVYGIPGSGKTVLSSWIINDQGHKKEIVIYHYFKDADANKRTPLSAVRSFIDQILNHLRHMQSPLLAQLESDLENASLERSRHADYTDLWNLFLPSAAALAQALSQQFQKSHTIAFVMDAMDECQAPSMLISDLLNLAQTHTGRIRVLVTGRKSAWDAIKQSIPPSFLAIDEVEITPEDVHDDIQAYVQHRISNVARLGGHQGLRDRLSDEIGRASNHQGMFLWAYFMCEEVKRQGDPVALQLLLDHLPKGLDAMYGRICQAIIDKDGGLGFSLSVLQWLVNSPRPMQFSELQDGLKLMRSSATSAALTQDIWFDETNDLLWSRQDIVDACGNLVVYTGLGDGDFFRLVHLSATQFFRGNFGGANRVVLSDTVKILVEDIQSAEFRLAALCLRYLTAEALHSHKYMTLSATYTSFPSTEEEDFLKQFPLFQFGVIYWPQFVLRGLSAKAGCRLVIPSFLERVVKTFHSTPAVIIWFVHAIELLNIEVVIDTLEQLATMNSKSPDLISIIAWARKSVDILTSYRDALSNWPELIRKCWPIQTQPLSTAPLIRTWQIDHETSVKTTNKFAHALPRIRYSWIDYNPRKDLLLGIEEDLMCLRVHLLKSGTSMRPGIVPSHPSMASSFPLRAAVVSPSSQFVAAIFDTEYLYAHTSLSHPVFLICWKMPGFSSVTSEAVLQAQPDLILTEKYNTALRSVPHSDPSFGMNPIPNNVKNHLSFLGDHVLVTPRGMWDLKKREWLPGPATLYQSINNIGDYCFSGNGERVAQIGGSGNVFSFFETRKGTCISQLRFPDTESLYPLAFSRSGQKLFFYRNLLQPIKVAGGCDSSYYDRWCTGFGNRPSCLIVDDQNIVDLYTPHHIHIGDSMQAQFSNDEETIVAVIDPCHAFYTGPQIPAIIGLWKLMRDSAGRYTHASFTHYYKEWSWFTTFCLVPALHNDPEMVVVAANGIVKQRSLNMTWSEDDDDAFLYQDPNNKREFVSVDPLQNTVTIKTLSKARNEKTSVSLKKWSFRPLPQHIITFLSGTLDASVKTITACSSDATYFVTDESLVQVFDDNTTLEQNERISFSLTTQSQKGRIRYTACSIDDRVVFLHHDDHESKATLIMNDIRGGSIFPIATSTIDVGKNPDRKLSFKINFNPVNSSHFLLTMIVGGNDDEYDHTTGQGFRAISFELLSQQLVSTQIYLPDDGGFHRRDVRFSPCGRYLIWGAPSQGYFPRVHSLFQKGLNHGDILHEDIPHPVVMENRQPYIYKKWVFVLDANGPHVKLYRRIWDSVGGLEHSLVRVVCIVPKNAENGRHDTFLIWPQDDEGEVTVVMAGDVSGLFVIESGILSGDLMGADAWIDKFD